MNNFRSPDFYRRIFSRLLLLTMFAANFSFAFAQTNRGAGSVRVKANNGQTKDVKLYDGSYALVIGNSNYQFWDNLPGVKSDVEAVKNALTRNGFTVETAADLNSRDLSDRIEQFIGDYGYVKNNRLLIYYAGHGHTQKTIDESDDREIGYIVPVDAPLPEKDALGFLRKAVNLEKIRTFAKEIQAKHAIFLFDSCFSGKLVSRSNIAVPAIVEESVTYPIRQFITAGSANQPVPDESIFRRAFVRALEGEADLNKDGYILGTELAAYLRDKVSNASRRTQTPQYGVIDDIALDRGDFVFTVTGKNTNAAVDPDKSKIDDTPTVARSRADIEREAWSYLKNSTDPQDFRDFLKEFPDGANAGNAKIKLEQAVWDAVKESKDKTKVQIYLKEFPSGTNAFLARTRMKQLEAAVVTIPIKKPNNNFAGLKAGNIRKNQMGMELVYIPAGDFMMGSLPSEKERSDDEGMQHKVTIREGFLIGKYEVTQTQYEQVMGNNPSLFWNCPQCPVERVSWIDAKNFIQKLNEKNDGFNYSLPSEAEWEYAARAGTTTAFAFGENLSSIQANFDGNYPYGAVTMGQSLEKTTPVGSYKGNSWGLYDMHGNVWEWCEDNYTWGYKNVPIDGSPNISKVFSVDQVMRGGSWA